MNVARENKKIELLSEEDLIKIGKPICLDENGNPVYIGDTYLDYNVRPNTPPVNTLIKYISGTIDGSDYIHIGFEVPNHYRLE